MVVLETIGGKVDLLQLNPRAALSALAVGMNPAFDLRQLRRRSSNNALYSALYFSTLFTSGWLALIVLSTTLLKFLAPLQRFTTWFFDVEKHPLQAVGIVTGILVVLGAAIWKVV